MKKLNIIQVGIRHEHAWGKMHTLRNFMQDTFNILGYVDDDWATTPYLGACHSVVEGLPVLTLEEAFNTPNLDAVFIEVPNLELVPIAMKFLEKGIPMHLDKPAGTDLVLYKALLDGCAAKKLPFQMGYMYRGNPVFQLVQKLVKAGALGDLFEVDLDMHHGYQGEPYQDYIGKLPGGIMFNLGCHLIDYAVSLLGAPDKVTSILKPTGDVAPHVLNNGLCILQYPHANAIIRMCSRKLGCVESRRMRIAGTKGWVEMAPLERFDGKSLVMDMSLKEDCCGYKAGVQQVTFPPQEDRYVPQLLEFAGMLRGTAQSSYSFDHDYLVHKLTLQAAQLL